jgi:uncharacterized protein (TIGR02145 family)
MGVTAILCSGLALGFAVAGCAGAPADVGPASASRPDGKSWTTINLNLAHPDSYCYGDEPSNCERYGRLYTWAAALHACRSMGADWRLPDVDDWRTLVQAYGGVHGSSGSDGSAAFGQLLVGGRSGLDMRLGGGRGASGYERLEAHGFYWTASEDSPSMALFVNLARGKRAVFLQEGGEKAQAFSVRCVAAAR